MLSSVALVVTGGGLVTLWSLLSARRYVMGNFSEFVGLVLRISPVGLIFPALAVLPVAIWVVGLVRHRYLAYTRPRRPVRQTVSQLYGVAAGVTGVVFVVLMLCYVAGAYGSVGLSSVTYDPSAVGYEPSEAMTFSQLLVFGDWVYFGFLCVWFGVHGAAYAVLGVTGVLVVRQPLVGLLLPWVCFVVAGFSLAIAGFEAFSPLTVTPFNLTQLPMWQPMVPAVVLILGAVGSMIAVIGNAERLRSAG